MPDEVVPGVKEQRAVKREQYTAFHALPDGRTFTLVLPNGSQITCRWKPHSQRLVMNMGMSALVIIPNAANEIELAVS